MTTKPSQNDAELIGHNLLELLRREESTQLVFQKVDKNFDFTKPPKWCWVVELSSGPEVERNGKMRPQDWLEIVFTCKGPDALANVALKALVSATEHKNQERSKANSG